MLVAENSKPDIGCFRQLMKATDEALILDAKIRPQYYAGRSGTELEDDVRDALTECAINTPFEGTINKISGSSFPDIVAAKYYGVEVKSTSKDKWTSTGSSILESTRIADVERIFLTFGKLGGKEILFLSRPYEECQKEIKVTHSPRYEIDMRLKAGESIFAKMKIEYDEFRKLEDPYTPVKEYYKQFLKDGERLWWADDKTDDAQSPIIRLWKNLSPEERENYIATGLVCFPEVFEGDFDSYLTWLVAHGVVSGAIRDQFSAGGRTTFPKADGQQIGAPGIFKKLTKHKHRIAEIIEQDNLDITKWAADVCAHLKKSEQITPADIISFMEAHNE